MWILIQTESVIEIFQMYGIDGAGPAPSLIPSTTVLGDRDGPHARHRRYGYDVQNSFFFFQLFDTHNSKRKQYQNFCGCVLVSVTTREWS